MKDLFNVFLLVPLTKARLGTMSGLKHYKGGRATMDICVGIQVLIVVLMLSMILSEIRQAVDCLDEIADLLETLSTISEEDASDE